MRIVCVTRFFSLAFFHGSIKSHLSWFSSQTQFVLGENDFPLDQTLTLEALKSFESTYVGLSLLTSVCNIPLDFFLDHLQKLSQDMTSLSIFV